MSYTPQIGKDFWFAFDNLFLWEPTPQSQDALRRAYDFGAGFPELDRPVDLLRTSYGTPSHPAEFAAGVMPNQTGIVDLARLQMGVINAHLSSQSDVQLAFEDFGQGVLFDDRRVPGAKVHKMDGDPEDWVGYHRWNAFARAVQVLGEAPNEWLQLNRCIGLAWAIQTESRPNDDDAKNPGLPEARLKILRDAWMAMPVNLLDWAFVTHRYGAPSPTEIAAQSVPATAPAGYAKVQAILEVATPSGNPRHVQGGIRQGRFWLKPYAEFISLSIYNQKLIADPGANRGANSALVKVLRGTLPGFPRMPRAPLPPVADADIQFISDWIDAGANEN